MLRVYINLLVIVKLTLIATPIIKSLPTLLIRDESKIKNAANRIIIVIENGEIIFFQKKSQ